jgi:hypothetical protein
VPIGLTEIMLKKKLCLEIAPINIKRHLTNQKFFHGDTITNATYQIQNTTKNSKNGPKNGGYHSTPPFFDHGKITLTNTLNNYLYTGCSFLPVLYLGHTVPIPIADHPSRGTYHYGGNGGAIPPHHPYIYRVFILTLSYI